jgi:hypothetical protein
MGIGDSGTTYKLWQRLQQPQYMGIDLNFGKK